MFDTHHEHLEILVTLYWLFWPFNVKKWQGEELIHHHLLEQNIECVTFATFHILAVYSIV